MPLNYTLLHIQDKNDLEEAFKLLEDTPFTQKILVYPKAQDTEVLQSLVNQLLPYSSICLHLADHEMAHLNMFNGLNVESLSVQHLNQLGSDKLDLIASFFPKLRTIEIEIGQKEKLSVQSFSKLKAVEEITFTGDFKDLNSLRALNMLQKLDLRCIEIEQIDFVNEMENLKRLQLGQVKLLKQPNHLNVSHLGLTMMKSLDSLEYWISEKTKDLHVDSNYKLSSIESLRTSNIEYLLLRALSKLKDLSPLQDMKALREVIIEDVRHLTVEDCMPIVNNKNLKKARIGLGSLSKNKAIAKILKDQGVEQDGALYT